ncbi:MAG: hypothetical protein NVS1B13_25550 [Flavisolibacter sp.]
MVQTDISQLSAECSEWRQILRNYKEEFIQSKESLQEICSQNLPKNCLLDIEHFDNQFHIQLINIHDLKQAIKLHEKKIALPAPADAAQDIFKRHELLLDRFLVLENTFQELRSEFTEFTGKVNNSKSLA